METNKGHVARILDFVVVGESTENLAEGRVVHFGMLEERDEQY